MKSVLFFMFVLESPILAWADPALITCKFNFREVTLVREISRYSFKFITTRSNGEIHVEFAQRSHHTNAGLSLLPKWSWLSSNIDSVDVYDQIAVDDGDQWYWHMVVGYDKAGKSVATYAEAYGPESWERACDQSISSLKEMEPQSLPPVNHRDPRP